MSTPTTIPRNPVFKAQTERKIIALTTRGDFWFYLKAFSQQGDAELLSVRDAIGNLNVWHPDDSAELIAIWRQRTGNDR